MHRQLSLLRKTYSSVLSTTPPLIPHFFPSLKCFPRAYAITPKIGMRLDPSFPTTTKDHKCSYVSEAAFYGLSTIGAVTGAAWGSAADDGYGVGWTIGLGLAGGLLVSSLLETESSAEQEVAKLMTELDQALQTSLEFHMKQSFQNSIHPLMDLYEYYQSLYEKCQKALHELKKLEKVKKDGEKLILQEKIKNCEEMHQKLISYMSEIRGYPKFITDVSLHNDRKRNDLMKRSAEAQELNALANTVNAISNVSNTSKK